MTTAEKLIQIAENEQRVYEAGYNAGNLLYYATTFQSLFDGVTFPENYKMTIKVKSVSNFIRFLYETKNIKSIKIISDDKDALLDATSAFRQSSQLETVDLTECSRKFSKFDFCLYSSPVKTILGDLDVSNCTSIAASSFETNTLEEVRFVIGTIKASINLIKCTKLSNASITSIINGLSADTSGLTVTLSKTAKESAFTVDEWNTLIATKSNWTISLV